ncbi:MAG: hypothetical protein M5U28_42405 [Sandaracinaceae bacterium]|nr:hypothetical protein [Sandaracinaceae bacterium]
MAISSRALVGAVGEPRGVAVLEEGLHGEPDLLGVLEARVGVRIHRAADDARELLGHALGDVGLREHDRGDDLHEGVAHVRRPPGDDLVEDGAEEVEIRPLAQAARRSAEHLGRHVERRARHLRGLRGQREATRAVVLQADGDAPVHEVDLAELADHHVLRLEIAVQHAAAVREADGVAHLHERAEVPLEQIALAEAIAHGARVVHQRRPVRALDLLEDDERRAVGADGDVVDGDDVRVLEAAGDPGLAEQLEHGVLGLVLVLEGLDRDLAAEHALGAEVHHAHAALADRAVQVELAVDRARAELAEERHGALAGGVDPQARRHDRRAGAALDGRRVEPHQRQGGLDRFGELVGARHRARRSWGICLRLQRSRRSQPAQGVPVESKGCGHTHRVLTSSAACVTARPVVLDSIAARARSRSAWPRRSVRATALGG